MPRQTIAAAKALDGNQQAVSTRTTTHRSAIPPRRLSTWVLGTNRNATHAATWGIAAASPGAVRKVHAIHLNVHLIFHPISPARFPAMQQHQPPTPTPTPMPITHLQESLDTASQPQSEINDARDPDHPHDEDDDDWTRDLPQTDHVRFFRSTDWGSTKLGPLKTWDSTLRIYTRMLFADSRAACLWWYEFLTASL